MISPSPHVGPSAWPRSNPALTSYGQHVAGLGTLMSRWAGYDEAGRRAAIVAMAQGADVLDTGGLARVLAVDAQSQTADVQGFAPYSTILTATLAYGLAPAVIAAEPLHLALTARGYGLASFHAGRASGHVVDMDVLAPDGLIVECTADRGHNVAAAALDGDGFGGLPLRVRLPLVPARPFVVFQSVPIEAPEDAIAIATGLASSRRFGSLRVDALIGSVSDGAARLHLGRLVGRREAKVAGVRAGLSGPSRTLAPRDGVDVLRFRDAFGAPAPGSRPRRRRRAAAPGTWFTPVRTPDGMALHWR